MLEGFEDFVRSFTIKNPIDEKLVSSLCQFDVSCYVKYGNINDTQFSRLLKKNFKTIPEKPRAVSYNRYLLHLYGFKKCSTCKNLLEISSFSKDKNNWDNRKRECKKCYSKYYGNNIEQFHDYYKEYYLEHKSEYILRDKQRRSTLTNACPAWLSLKQIEEIRLIYKNCPDGQHVDHIVPLQGDNVCGLHVPWNLQYLTQLDNLRKGNKL